MGIHTGKGWDECGYCEVDYDNVMVVHMVRQTLLHHIRESTMLMPQHRRRISFAASKPEMNEMIPNPNARMTFPRKRNEADAFDYDNG